MPVVTGKVVLLLDHVRQEHAVDGVGDRLAHTDVGQRRIGDVELEPVDRTDGLVASAVTTRSSLSRARTMLLGEPRVVDRSMSPPSRPSRIVAGSGLIWMMISSRYGRSGMKKSSNFSMRMIEPASYSVRRNGPEPTKSSVLRGCSATGVPSLKMCSGMIGNRPGDIASRIAGCGWLSCTIGGLVVGRLDVGDRCEHRLERVVVAGGLDRELDVFAGDRLAVVEDGALDQVQRHRQAVVGDLPALGEVGLRVEVLVEQQRARVQLGAGHRGGETGLHGAVEVTRHLGAADDERATGDGAAVDGTGLGVVALDLFELLLVEGSVDGLLFFVVHGVVLLFGVVHRLFFFGGLFGLVHRLFFFGLGLFFARRPLDDGRHRPHRGDAVVVVATATGDGQQAEAHHERQQAHQ